MVQGITEIAYGFLKSINNCCTATLYKYESMQNSRSVVGLLRFATYCIILIILCLVCISTFIKRKCIKTTVSYYFSLSYSQKD